jgi:uncharacterized membrane protein YidH (DUF202 family)
MIALVAQIALGVIIGGFTLALLLIGFIAWVQSQQGRGNKRLETYAIGLFIAGAVMVLVLFVLASIH